MLEPDEYIDAHSAAGDDTHRALLRELERATNQRVIQPKMVSGSVQGAMLTLITKMLRPKLVLEIGTFTGYSALSIAAGLDDDARLHTVEVDDELEDMARSFFDRSGHGGKIALHIGSALEVVPCLAAQLGRPFDMVFIDGDKREYPDYYRMLMGDGRGIDPSCGVDARKGGEAKVETGDRVGRERENILPPMLRSGSIILADNVLWYGKVAEKIHPSDRHTAGIVEFNRSVVTDPRVENVILPLRDGINLIRVK